MTNLRSSWILKDRSSASSSKSTGHTHRMKTFRKSYVCSLQSLEREIQKPALIYRSSSTWILKRKHPALSGNAIPPPPRLYLKF
uniref:Uncharacterized protein n=1 Tax=Arundo donax TaxID=35708 RepID=A0A0A9CT85_ARUDO